MIRFAVATVATFAILMLATGSVTIANSTGLFVEASSLDKPSEFYVYGYVDNTPSTAIPSSVELSGAISGFATVREDGTFEASRPAPPGDSGTVYVTARYGNEVATDSVTVNATGPGGGPF